MITLKLTFATFEEAQDFLKSKINAGRVAPAEADAPKAKVSDQPDAAQPAPQPQPEKPAARRGRPPKNATVPTPAAGEAPVPAQPAPVAEAPAAKPADDKLTPDQDKRVREALMKVNDKFKADGFAKVAETLAPFGVTHVRDIKASQLDAIIAAAEKAAA